MLNHLVYANLSLAAISFRCKDLLWRDKKKPSFQFCQKPQVEAVCWTPSRPILPAAAEQNFHSGMILLLCKSCSDWDNHLSFQSSLVSPNNFRMKVLILFHPVSPPNYPYYSHHVIHSYQTGTLEWVLVCHLWGIVKTAVLPCSANKLKSGNKKRQRRWFIETSATVRKINDGHKSTLTKSQKNTFKQFVLRFFFNAATGDQRAAHTAAAAHLQFQVLSDLIRSFEAIKMKSLCLYLFTTVS